MADVFVSYRNEDRACAGRLVGALEAQGLNVWWDRQLEAGAAWRDTIAHQLEAARCVLVLWSASSVGPLGRFVQDEADRALGRGTYLPVLIDPVPLPLGFGGVQAVGLAGWSGDQHAPPFQFLLAAVRAMLEGEPAPAMESARASARVGRRTLIAAGLGAAALAAAAVARHPLTCAIAGCGPLVGAPASVAVLPFRTLGPNSDQDYLGEGIAEELRTALAHIATIRVAARASSTLAQKRDPDFRDIARQLGVRYVVDGSVRRAPDRVRVAVTLVEAETGFEKWSQIFDRPLTDLLALQSGIAASVAQALSGTLAPNERAALAILPTSNPQAYDDYLRGARLFDLSGDEATYRAALALFDHALALDPQFAVVHALRARTLAAIANQFLKPPNIRPVYDQALAAARRAIAIAPDLGPAQCALGYVLAYGFLDVAHARAPYARSIALDPNNADILVLYGTFASRFDAPATGITALQHAVTLDPLNPRAFKALASAQLYARDYPAAIASANRALELSPAISTAHDVIGDAHYLQGDIAGALAAYAREPVAYLRLVGLAIGMHRSGNLAGARAALATLVRDEGNSAAYQQAQIHAQWGERDAALAALARARAAADLGVLLAKNDPLLDPIRQDPRFVAFLSGLGLT